jgi:acetyl esterase/lipase
MVRVWVVGLLCLGTVGCPGWSERTGHLDGITVLEDVSYAGGSSPVQAADFYLPAGNGPRPLALFVHGGLWSAQGRRFLQWLTGLYGGAGLALARQGYSAGVLGYRQHPDVTAQGSLKDLATAVAWTQANAAKVGGDPKCVVLVGHSAGALFVSHLLLDKSHLTAAGGDPSGIAGVVLLAGLHVVEPTLKSLKADERAAVHTLFGATPAERTAWNPTTLPATGTTVPILLLGGAKDNAELLEQQTAMVAALKDQGVSVETATLEGQDHMDLTPSRTHEAVARHLNPFLARVAAGCAQRR